MSRINQVIPVQGFEVVRETIAAILTTELSYQKANRLGLEDFEKVFVGRSTPFDHREVLMLNILVDNGDYSRHHEKGVDNKTSYIIDIYVSSKGLPNEPGGYISTKKRDFYTGLVTYILRDNHYQTLGLEKGLIMNTSVNGFENFEQNNNEQTSFIKMSRVSFSVSLYEFQTLWEGIDLNSIFTNVKLGETERGYYYESILNE